MGFIILEIAGLAVLGVACLLQIGAVATIKWVTAANKYFEGNYGIFKYCIKNLVVKVEGCKTNNWATSIDKEGSLNAVRGMAVLALLAVIATILLIVVFKLVLKKDAKIPLIVLGILAALFQIVAVGVFGGDLRPKFPEEYSYGASFYVGCISVVFIAIGAVLSAIGAQRAAS